MVLVKKAAIVTKTWVPEPIIVFKNDEDDYEEELDDEPAIIANSSAFLAKSDSPSKHLKPRPGHHSVSALLPLAKLSMVKVKSQGSHIFWFHLSAYNISFDTITMRPVDAEEVHWLSTATMDLEEALQVPQLRCCMWQLSTWKEGERTPKKLCQLLDNADLLVKVFDSTCETAGQLSELLHENCEAIDAVVHDTVEFKGHAVAEESLITDVSAINRIMGKFATQEVDSVLLMENSETPNSSLWRLIYDDPHFASVRSLRSPVINNTDDLNLEYPGHNEDLTGETDTEGELDPDVKV
ncbi:hypothetical protein EDD85DRAFT_798550 [Armillaria nabsnona]|nr:hypothetical protein EDD85DRAFT_798550 [Armillaria nabsnona]